MKRTKHLLLTQEKVRKGPALNLVEEDFQKRTKTCHTSDATIVTIMDTMLETVLKNQTTVTKVRTKVSTKVRVKENIMYMPQMIMSIRRRDLG